MSNETPRCPIPHCRGQALIVERRMNGNAKCISCGWKGSYSDCFSKEKDLIKKLQSDNEKLRAALSEARDALEFYANEHNWILTTENEFSKIKRTISRDDSESWGYQASPESVNIVITVGGKQARAAVENINDALIKE